MINFLTEAIEVPSLPYLEVLERIEILLHYIGAWAQVLVVGLIAVFIIYLLYKFLRIFL